MLTFRDIRQAQLPGPTALTIGNFDGLHLGHQALLEQLREVAQEHATGAERPLRTAILTFDPHPLTVFRPN
jgi:riboflavin kinase/FMN adenylyltransferase